MAPMRLPLFEPTELTLVISYTFATTKMLMPYLRSPIWLFNTLLTSLITADLQPVFAEHCVGYLIGYLIATLSILLVIRNPSVSPWFALLVNAYPILETLFTIWRRKVHQGKNPGLPDGAHFHSLIYRRIIRWAEVHELKDTASYAKNAKTSPYLWLLSSLAVFPAIVWWQTTWILQCFALLFCVSYVFAYNAVVKFKTPGIFKLLK